MRGGSDVKRLAGLALLAALALGACAQPASVKPMTAPAAKAPAPRADLADAVCVELVRGGKKTNPLWVSEVDNTSFRRALEASLRNRGMLAETSADCRYGVEAHLLGLSQPYVSIDVEVTANVNYRVRQAGVAEPYLLKTATTRYTARFASDRILWATRLKQANEGAIRKNIRAFIDAL